ncbi:MAG: hypothetical protein ACE37F_08450 [Nannocystaceae bacterium]|nr:hypothetical protein [bacterium]
MRKSKFTNTLLVTFLGLGLAVAVAPTAHAELEFECSDEGNLCVESGGNWSSGSRTSSKDRRKQSKKTAGTLTVRIEGGRGSIFINGRYAGTAPLEGIEIPSGKNDLQIRDGADVLATGVLTVPKDSDVIAVVRHP